MKRMVAVLLMILLLLSGCGKSAPQTIPEQEANPPQAETPVTGMEKTPDAPEEQEAVSEPESVPEPPKEEAKPVAEPEPIPAPESEAEESAVLEEVSVPQSEVIGMDWAAYAAEAYTAITDHPEFHVLIWEEDDTSTELVIRQGENDWNVANRKENFSAYEWTQITYEEVLAETQTEGRGPELGFWDVEGGMSFSCFKNRNVVIIRDQTKITYLRAVNPDEGQDSMEGNLYDLLEWVAVDAVLDQVWRVTVDGNLSPEQAAKKMAEKVAENYKNMPEWIDWTPTKARREYTEVFDIYLGEPGEFCCNMNLEFKFDRPEQGNVIYLQAGAGLGEPDEDGYCSYFSQVHARRNEKGDWAFLDRGTGGAMVNPKWPAEKPWVDWLVELFCLTEGQSHEWYVPGQILSLPPDQMELLPAILDQLTEAEAKDLCSTMGKLLREQEDGYYTVDTMKPLLGDYAHWLDA